MLNSVDFTQQPCEEAWYNGRGHHCLRIAPAYFRVLVRIESNTACEESFVNGKPL